MKIPLGILAIVVVILLLSQYFAPRPDPATLQPRTDLPWQITRNADGTSRVRWTAASSDEPVSRRRWCPRTRRPSR